VHSIRHLFPVKVKVGSRNKYGYIDDRGSVIVEPQFTSAGWFENGFAVVTSTPNSEGVIDESGQICVPPIKDSRIKGYSPDGLSGCFVGEIPNDLGGVIDGRGNFVIPCNYRSIGYCAEGRVPFRREAEMQHGYLDYQNRVVIPPQYDSVGSFRSGRAIVGKEDRFGFIDLAGNIAIPFDFERASAFHEGLALVRIPNDLGWSAIDTGGRWRFRSLYDVIYTFSEGLAGFRNGDSDDALWGFINTAGQVAIDPIHEAVAHFSEGIGRVFSDGRWFYVNRDGTRLFSEGFDECSEFRNGLALVKAFGKKRYGYINNVGVWIWSTSLDMFS
jgi:hypothetical protein